MKKVMFQKFTTCYALLLCAAIIGGLSSCKKDHDDPTPTPDDIQAKVTYTLSGTATDDQNLKLENVTVSMTGKQTKSVKTDASGAFKFDLGDNPANAAGNYQLKFELQGYRTVSANISVKEIKNGSADYTVNAMLAKIAEVPVVEYKTPVYALNIRLNGAETATGLQIEVKDPDGTVLEHESGASFTLTNLPQPGLYSISVSATGFNAIKGQIMVNAVEKQVKKEGDEDTFTVTTTAAYDLIAETPEEPAPASYFISGKILDINGNAIDATIRLKNNSGLLIKEWTGSEYEVANLTENDVKDVSFTLLVEAEGYYDYITAFTLQIVEAGQILDQVINVVMSKIPAEEEIKEITVKETATSLAEQEAEIGMTTEVEEESGKKIATITAPEKIKIEPIVTTITKDNGTKEEVKDKISFDKGEEEALVITYPETATDHTLKFTRDVAGEEQINNEPAGAEETVEAPVVARIYEGTPDGTTFSSPVKISFPAPYNVTNTAQAVKMNLLYKTGEGKWVADGDNYVELNAQGEYVASVHHFSSFAPGFETNIEKMEDTTFTETSDKYHGQSFKQGELKMTALVDMGMIYADRTAAEAVADALGSKAPEAQAYITELLKTKIKADNAGLCPTTRNFGEKRPKEITFRVDKQYTIDHLTLTTTYTLKNYTIRVEGQAITVSVKTAASHSITVAYTQEHAGHGSDLNAGGGIIDFE